MTRGSVRLRLTVLFASLFLIAGAGLLGITYTLVSHATNGIIVARVSAGPVPGGAGPGSPVSGGEVPGGAVSGGTTAGGPVLAGPGGGGLPDLRPVQAQATREADETRAAENEALLLYSGVALGIMALVSAALGWFVAGRALRPLRRITTAARRISATNLHERLALDGADDDVRELADMIDGLFARLDASLHSQRQFVANASHELRTPLARSRTLLEVALRDPAASTGSLRAACERALAAGAEQERLIEALLVLARGQRGLVRREPLDLAVITRDVLAARGGEITERGLAVDVTLAPALLAGDAALAERAVANLADNALRYNRADGAVWVCVESDGGRAVLTVANTGPEIPPGEADRLLLPFQRGGFQDGGFLAGGSFQEGGFPAGGAAGAPRVRPRTGADDGLGLGLSIVAAIASAHGADLTVTPRLTGGGLTARLAFPASLAFPDPTGVPVRCSPERAAGVAASPGARLRTS